MTRPPSRLFPHLCSHLFVLIACLALPALLLLNTLADQPPVQAQEIGPAAGPPASAAATATLDAVSDTYVNEVAPDATAGSLTELYAGRLATGDRRELIRFDLSSIPAGSTIHSATLTLYAVFNMAAASDAPAAANQVYAVRNTASWKEATVSWNTRPATAAAADDTPTKVDPGSAAQYDLAVTGAVRQWITNGATNNGFTLRGDGSSTWPTLMLTYSRESSTAAQRPKLVVSYTPPGVTPTATRTPTPTATRAPTDTPTRTPTSSPLVSGACPGTLMIRAAQDSWIDEANPTATHGSENELRSAVLFSKAAKAWIGFPLTRNLIPPGQHIYSAKLRVAPNYFGGDEASSTDVWITDLTKGPWNEATLSWSNFPVPYGGSTVTGVVLRDQAISELDVLQQVRDRWLLGGIDNYGFEIFSARELHFLSSEYASVALRPQLVITCGNAPPTATPTRTVTPTPTVTPSPTVTPRPIDYRIEAVEVTQGIARVYEPGGQAPPSGEARVWGKPTFVKVYVSAGFYGSPVEVHAGSVSVRLVHTGPLESLSGGNPEPLDAIQKPAKISASTNSRDEANVWLFELPFRWIEDGLTVEARIFGPDEPQEFRNNNVFSRTLNYRALPPLCAVYIPVRAHSGTPSDQAMSPMSADGLAVRNRALTLLPLYKIWSYYQTEPVEEYQWESASYGPYELDSDTWKIVHSLWWRDQLSDDPDECDDAGARTHYIGVVKAGPGDNDFNGMGAVGGDQMVFRMAMNSAGAYDGAQINQPWGGRTLAHELGHNYDLEHVGCGTSDDEPLYPYDNCHFSDGTIDWREQQYGFDPITRKAIPAAADVGDLMSYASVRWTSDWTWNYLFLKLKLGAAAQAAEQALWPDATPALLLSIYQEPETGQVRFDRLQLTDPAHLPATKLQEITRAAGGTGPWTVQVLGNGGAALASYSFEPARLSGDDRDYPFAAFAVPWPASATGVRLLVDGAVSEEKSLSPSAPTVQITSPSGGETFTGPFDLTWQGSDADGDWLHYTVQYSADGGATWQVLRAEYPNTSLTLDAGKLAGSAGQALLRVIASDGFRTGSANSKAFSVGKHAPALVITSPAEGARYQPGTAVNFSAEAWDLEDGVLPSPAFEWHVGGAGAPLTGATTSLVGLAPGAYTATVYVADSDGQPAAATVTFWVGSLNTYLPLILR